MSLWSRLSKGFEFLMKAGAHIILHSWIKKLYFVFHFFFPTDGWYQPQMDCFLVWVNIYSWWAFLDSNRFLSTLPLWASVIFPSKLHQRGCCLWILKLWLAIEKKYSAHFSLDNLAYCHCIGTFPYQKTLFDAVNKHAQPNNFFSSLNYWTIPLVKMLS